MKKVSQILQEKRILSGISLKQVFFDTKIPKHQLLNIENSDWLSFTSYAYLQGVVKKYALYLGLDTQNILSYLKREITDYNVKFIRQSDYKENNVFFRDRWYIYLIVLLVSGFFLIQVFVSWQKPLLKLNPIPKYVSVNKPLIINGQTEQGVLLYLNGERIYQDEKGIFQKNLYFKTVGTRNIRIQAIGINGKEEVKEFQIIIKKP